MPHRTDEVWTRHAAQWERVGAPLRPGPADGVILERVARRLADRHGPPRVLVLGVTPEMARIAWPDDTDLLAIDRSAEMIGSVWPGFPRPGEGARLDDWRTMELPPASRDLVVGDGVFAVIAFPGEATGVLRTVRQVLAPHGRFAVRAFVRPEVAESPGDALEAAMSGRVGSFHALKLRLLMAVQATSSTGVRTGDVWQAWTDGGPGADALAERTGWPAAQIATIDAYRGQDTVYAFPTLAELRGVAEEAGFDVDEVVVPAYELGERCPTLVLAPASRRAR